MFGISYGELFLLIRATAALVGPKDLPRIASREVSGSVNRVHKELQDAFAQLESIPYEVRSISLMNPGPMARRLMDNPQDPASLIDGSILSSHTLLARANSSLEKPKEELKSRNTVVKDDTFRTSDSPNLHSQAIAYAKLAESDAVKTGSLKSSAEQENLKDESGLFIVLPVSAESTGMLPNRKGYNLLSYDT
ncbi:uncharacterized protein LOC110748883 [Prunus avium]|uniref:Uncharacterized protein LOC110748883 n=1 Tax=Prunus avium TaxID=42229 RepID=A0A6P5RPN2_PRUAV|nr:uncharacterized protein LOC110748883 [Prunus avium]